ncbi:MAG: Brp/Blh family beta-carotene 15,15'-dioxygenase, partial [Halobacteria archaeon]|nr:Brp/Blh family beta-carotene 15,15'-dioxygenase [Halobacteria archaeon]
TGGTAFLPRYVDWLLTTPIHVVFVALLTGAATRCVYRVGILQAATIALGFVGALLATLTVASVLRVYLSDSNSDAWRLEVGETGLLWLYFAVVPPVFAVGVYFCVWHSTRHIARVVLLDSESRKGLETGVTPALGKFAKEAAPLTVLSLVFLAGFYVAVPNPPALRMGALPDLIALYLVFVSVLTLPHVAITTWLDRKQLT